MGFLGNCIDSCGPCIFLVSAFGMIILTLVVVAFTGHAAIEIYHPHYIIGFVAAISISFIVCCGFGYFLGSRDSYSCYCPTCYDFKHGFWGCCLENHEINDRRIMNQARKQSLETPSPLTPEEYEYITGEDGQPTPLKVVYINDEKGFEV